MTFENVKMNDRQRRLLDLFQKHPERDLDEIMAFFGCDVWRASVVSSIKSLSAKMVPHGFHIVRTTPLGRGNRAIYRMERIGKC